VLQDASSNVRRLTICVQPTAENSIAVCEGIREGIGIPAHAALRVLSYGHDQRRPQTWREVYSSDSAEQLLDAVRKPAADRCVDVVLDESRRCVVFQRK